MWIAYVRNENLLRQNYTLSLINKDKLAACERKMKKASNLTNLLNKVHQTISNPLPSLITMNGTFHDDTKDKGNLHGKLLPFAASKDNGWSNPSCEESPRMR